MMRRSVRGWSAVEMTVVASLLGFVMVAGATFVGTMSRTTARGISRAAVTEQANQFADILERMTSRSISFWGNSTYGGEPNFILFCLPDDRMASGTNSTDPSIYNDPNGNSWLWGPGRYGFYWSGADGVFGTSDNSMPMMGRVNSWDPLSITPIPKGLVDGSGKSLFPAVTHYQLSGNFDTGIFVISVTARTDLPSGGRAQGVDSSAKEEVVVRRVVRRPK